MNKRYPPSRNNRGTLANWPIIITCFIIWPLFPVGLVLLFIRLNNRNKETTSEYRHGHYYSDSAKNFSSGHIYTDDHDMPPKYSNERKPAGKASFIVSLAFFFVGGIIIIDALESFFWDNYLPDIMSQMFGGLCFVGVGLYLIWPQRRAGNAGRSLSSFIVSASLFFVGGMIAISVIEDTIYNGVYYGNGATIFVGACFIIAAFCVFRPKKRGEARNRLYERYRDIVGSKRAVAIWDIAVAIPVSMGKAYSDLQKMINLGYFGRTAFLDKKIGYLLMDTEAYDDIPTEGKKEKEKEEEHHINKNEVKSILGEIRRYNESIADPILSEQIARLESVVDKIFRAVEEDPKKRPQIQTFLDYYLPTTLKLIKTYSQLERQGESGENITNAKIKIEDTMEELVSGYERLLDRLYQGDVMDISSDIEVLETMMAKDGYSNKNRIQIDKD